MIRIMAENVSCHDLVVQSVDSYVYKVRDCDYDITPRRSDSVTISVYHRTNKGLELLATYDYSVTRMRFKFRIKDSYHLDTLKISELSERLYLIPTPIPNIHVDPVEKVTRFAILHLRGDNPISNRSFHNNIIYEDYIEYIKLNAVTGDRLVFHSIELVNSSYNMNVFELIIY